MHAALCVGAAQPHAFDDYSSPLPRFHYLSHVGAEEVAEPLDADADDEQSEHGSADSGAFELEHMPPFSMQALLTLAKVCARRTDSVVPACQRGRGTAGVLCGTHTGCTL